MAEVWDAARQPAGHRTAPTAKSRPAPEANSAEVGKPAPGRGTETGILGQGQGRVQHFPETVRDVPGSSQDHKLEGAGEAPEQVEMVTVPIQSGNRGHRAAAGEPAGPGAPSPGWTHAVRAGPREAPSLQRARPRPRSSHPPTKDGMSDSGHLHIKRVREVWRQHLPP